MLFEAAKAFMRANATILNHYGRGSNIFLPAGSGVFCCNVVKSSGGKRVFTYARARTHLSPEMLRRNAGQHPVAPANDLGSSVLSRIFWMKSHSKKNSMVRESRCYDRNLQAGSSNGPDWYRAVERREAPRSTATERRAQAAAEVAVANERRARGQEANGNAAERQRFARDHPETALGR